MKFPTELRIFVDYPIDKPRTFEEYIINQIEKGCNINFRKKEAFDMLDCLKQKREQLVAKLNTSADHESDIQRRVAEFESQIRNEYKAEDEKELLKIQNQLEIVDELIKEQENAIDNCQSEDCDATNENINVGE